MKLIEKNDDLIVFETQIEDSLANALRRYVNHVPVLAVDEIEISKNDSPLYDETIAHRIGLIPLKADKGKKEAKLKLSVSKEGMIHSKELKGDAKPVFDNIPITYINAGQEFEIEATTKIGLGIEHAKFSPGLMFYRNVAEITIDKDLKGKIKSMASDNEIKEKGNKIVVVDNLRKEVADLCDSLSNEEGKKAEIELKNDLIVSIESFGQMSPEEIFKKSVEELKKDLEHVSKKVDKE